MNTYDECRRAAYGYLRRTAPSLADHHDDIVQDSWAAVLLAGQVAPDAPLFVAFVRRRLGHHKRAMVQRRDALERHGIARGADDGCSRLGAWREE